ncbi:hypothetical protein LVJ94_46380 [Pendulispora rubella]|uniref:Uncharacterized protein n=1 Tax=Pendulispora rubella TaxID=2741070 RepID=A0ABZ2L432_9BACT
MNFRSVRIPSLIVGTALVAGACRCSPTPPRGEVKTAAPKIEEEPVVMAKQDDPPDLEVPTECPAALAQTRRHGTRPNAYVIPSVDELRQGRAWMAQLLAGDARMDAAHRLGFETVPLEEWPDTVLVREVGDRRRGGGAYVVRKGSASSLLVQAPHTFYDQGTFPLACELFQRTRARALFINTVHRYRASPAAEDGSHPSDVAHAANSIFHAFTEGAVDAITPISVVQLHGFVERNVPAHAVVSTGEKQAGGPLVAKTARALEGVLGPRVFRYPEDTRELGALTNVQGILVRRAGGRFLHVEMAEATRRDLLRDASLRAKTLDALGASVMAP